ncbi:MFS transporter [Lysinimonas soli]|uniref:MFS transporter n=1 Tax=Lysinimonas soli TaxID=1074233 RepID=A0ABW0NRQ6_9MICO
MTRSQRLVLIIAILSTFVSFLDGTIVNVALPAIMRELGGGLTAQQWIVDAYLITLGSLILVAGSVSDVYGRITVLRVGLAAFGAASLAVGLAPTAEFLIIARGVQGIAGALLVPSSLALITSNFRGPAQAKAIGTWTGMTGIAMIAGPLVGGLFVDFASWRFAFLINVLPIAVTLVLLARLGQKDQREPGVSIDYLGAVLCTLGLGGAVFALIEQSTLGWASPAIYLPLVGGIVAFAGFLVRQRLAKNPVMPLGLFRVRNFWAGNIATALIYGALSLSSFALGVYLQQGALLPATLAGLASIPVTVIMILFSSRVGVLSGRYGPRLFMTIGPITAGIGSLLMLSISVPFVYWWQVLPGILLFGLGLTATVSPLTSAILGSIDPSRSGIASAVNNAVSRVAGLIVIAMLGVIVGGSLDLAGVHRAMIAVAVLLILGGIVSFLGIRNPVHEVDAADQASAMPTGSPERQA